MSSDQSDQKNAIPVFDSAPLYHVFVDAGSALLKSGRSQIDALLTSTAGLTVSVYDGTSAAGTLIVVIVTSSAVPHVPLKIQVSTGLFISVAGTGMTTVSYR